MLTKTLYYDDAFKRRIVDEVLSGKETVFSARKKYNIGGKMTIYQWLKKHQNGTSLTMNNKQQTTNTSGSDSNQQNDTSKEVEALRLKVLALETMIDVAEKELGINIRKKSYAKQSKPSEKN